MAMGDGALGNPIVLSIIKMLVCVCWFSDEEYIIIMTPAPSTNRSTTHAIYTHIADGCCWLALWWFSGEDKSRTTLRASHGSSNNNYNNRRMLTRYSWPAQ